jgi:hypothetical protein
MHHKKRALLMTAKNALRFGASGVLASRSRLFRICWYFGILAKSIPLNRRFSIAPLAVFGRDKLNSSILQHPPAPADRRKVIRDRGMTPSLKAPNSRTVDARSIR